MEKNLKDAFVEIFKLSDKDADALSGSSTINNVPNWDSLGHMRLIIALEKKFGISIPDEKAIELVSIEKIEAFVETAKGAAKK